MEKKAQLYEIIIKLTFAVISFVAAIFVVKNIISMLPLFKSLSCSEKEIYELIYQTNIGNILNEIGIVSNFNFLLLVKGFVAFLKQTNLLAILFLVIIIATLLLHFIFIKWKLLSSYLKISALIILSYILKYLSFAALFGLIYKYSTYTLALSLTIGNVFYLIFSIFELFLFSLYIVRFVLNISGDIKYYCSHWKI